jgi:hypothetical protein
MLEIAIGGKSEGKETHEICEALRTTASWLTRQVRRTTGWLPHIRYWARCRPGPSVRFRDDADGQEHRYLLGRRKHPALD